MKSDDTLMAWIAEADPVRVQARQNGKSASWQIGSVSTCCKRSVRRSSIDHECGSARSRPSPDLCLSSSRSSG